LLGPLDRRSVVNTINSKGLHSGEVTGAAIFDLNGQKIYELKTEMQGLEEMAAKLLKTARNLPPWSVRHDILKEIDKFRVRIAALKAKGK
jgi:hypothetical protein